MRRNLLFNETSSNDYLTMEALEDSMTVSFSTNTIQYSTNGGSSWANLAPGSSTPAINTGQKISFKAAGLTPTSSAGIGTFTVSKKYNLLGSVMSMNYDKQYETDKTQYYTINLNNQWQSSSKNPSSSKYTAYQSFSNKGVNNTAAIMTIVITGYTNFKFYIRSYGQTNYDYVMVSQLDTDINNDTAYSNTTLVKAHTRGKATSGTALSNHTLVEYTNIDGGTHIITIVYKKNASSHNYDDRGYILIPKEYTNTDTLSFKWIENPDITKSYQFLKLFYNNTTLQSVSKDFLPATVLKDHCYDQMFTKCTALTNVPNLPATELTDYCYYSMFHTCSSVTSVPDNYLPATIMKSNCYAGLFNGTGLTKAPNLPAMSMASRCYYALFYNCKSLTAAPTLPATTMVSECYLQMFQGCTSLTATPSLPATTLADYCYKSMFNGCTSLTSASTLPATTLKINCYESMFQGCTKLTTAPGLSATTLANYCYYNMFRDCTKLTAAPVLKATTLANYCYYSMFRGCTSLVNAPALPATTLASYCYYDMFAYCTALTTAPTLSATTLVSNCYRTMFYGCSKLKYVKALFTTTPSDSYTNSWLYGVAATGTFVQSNSATWYVVGASGIPVGWTLKNASGTSLNNTAIEKNNAVAGDILCANSSGNKIVVSAAKYNQIPNGYTPIGVVVVPPSHNVYGTGEGAAVSLKYMDPTSPDTGSIYGTAMYNHAWNVLLYNHLQYEIPVDTFGNYQYSIVYWGKSGSSNWGDYLYVDTSIIANMPIQCELAYRSYNVDPIITPTDPLSGYAYPHSREYRVQSPYNSSGGRNTSYYQNIDDLGRDNITYFDGDIDDLDGNNIFSDFDGKYRTNVLLSYSGSSYKTETSFADYRSDTTSRHVAACCAWRYHTTGTNQGDWYLPAAGECTYLNVRAFAIGTTIYNLKVQGYDVISLREALKYDVRLISSSVITHPYQSSIDDPVMVGSVDGIDFSNSFMDDDYGNLTNMTHAFIRF